jgi:hypothetical protein
MAENRGSPAGGRDDASAASAALRAKGKRGIEKRQIATVEPVLHDPHRGVAVDGMDKTVEELMQLWPIVTGDKAVVLLLLTKIVRDNQRLREIFRDAVASGDVVADKILILAADHRGESLIVAIIKGDFGVGKRLLNNIEKSAIAGAGQRDAAVSGQRRQGDFSEVTSVGQVLSSGAD